MVDDGTPPDAQLTWKQRLHARWNVVRPYVPFFAFVCGFVFDSVTLGRRVTELDLYLVSGYALFALVGVLLREFSLPSWGTRGATILMQFSLGGALSAIVVLYFKSTGSPLSLVLMLALFATMVGNEFIHRDEPPQRAYVLALWVVAASMLANFVVPHVVKSVSPLWFYVSVFGAVAVLVVFKVAFRFAWRELRLALPAAALLTALWILGFVPPVPLVHKNNLVCTDFVKDGYTCAIDEPSLWQSLGITNTTVHTDNAVYCLTAVFAPPQVEVTMQHRWFQHTEDGWKQTDDMEFEMRGGRSDGWRFWSRKRKIEPGLWKVETALQDGPVLGYHKFEVVRGSATKVSAAL